MNTAESVKFLSTKDKHKGQNVISTDQEGKHQHFSLYPNTFLFAAFTKCFLSAG